MNDISDAIPVPHYRVRLGELTVDSRARICTKTGPDNTTPPLLRQPTYPTQKERIKKPHIILDRANPESSGDALKYLPVEPATFGMVV